MSRKTFLITGGAGFIGSNFILFFLKEHADYKIINLDALTYAGDLSNLEEIDNSNLRERYTFIKGDICDREFIKKLFIDYDIRGVIHFAAESHVDNSISNPDAFIKTNINGTFTLLEVSRQYWMEKSFKYKTSYSNCRFLHISTDEVYGSLGENGLFSETTPFAPNSPYSASKASSDLLVRSYFHTYGLNVVTTNCSNNYGPKQHSEKLIPTIIRKALSQAPIPIYGDGLNIRDWLFVLDHCKGINLAFHSGVSGETYNIGGRNEKNNLEIVHAICKILDEKKPISISYRDLITFVPDRPGHDKRYAVDASKIESQLNWKAEEDFDSGIIKTIEWYINNQKVTYM